MGCGCSSSAENGIEEIGNRSTNDDKNQKNITIASQKQDSNGIAKHAGPTQVNGNSSLASKLEPKENSSAPAVTQPATDDTSSRPRPTYSTEDAANPLIQVAFEGKDHSVLRRLANDYHKIKTTRIHSVDSPLQRYLDHAGVCRKHTPRCVGLLLTASVPRSRTGGLRASAGNRVPRSTPRAKARTPR